MATDGDGPRSPYLRTANRYQSLVAPEVRDVWRNTFMSFDRDGTADVDLRELGLMFRSLGHCPTEAAMRLLVEEVDADNSGTVRAAERVEGGVEGEGGSEGLRGGEAAAPPAARRNARPHSPSHAAAFPTPRAGRF